MFAGIARCRKGQDSKVARCLGGLQDGLLNLIRLSHEQEIDERDSITATPVDDSAGDTSTQRSTIQNVIRDLVQAVDDNEQDSDYLATRTGLTVPLHSCIKDHLDYLNAQSVMNTGARGPHSRWTLG